MLELLSNSVLLSCVVYVWLLSPFPHKISRAFTPKKTPLTTFQGVIDWIRLELSNAVLCDKCNGFWWGVTFGLITGLNPLEVLTFACMNVVVTKIIYNNVP